MPGVNGGIINKSEALYQGMLSCAKLCQVAVKPTCSRLKAFATSKAGYKPALRALRFMGSFHIQRIDAPWDHERSTPNAQRPTPNAQRPTLNAQRSTPNVQRPTPNAQRPTLNAQRSTPNAQHSTLNEWLFTPSRRGRAGSGCRPGRCGYRQCTGPSRRARGSSRRDGPWR